MNILRCQSVKIKNISQEESYYQDLQTDYKVLMKFFVEQSGMGYLIWDNDVPTIVEPRNVEENLKELIDIIGKGGTKAGNCYGLFYSKYKSETTPRKNSKVYRFTQSLARIDEEAFSKEFSKIGYLSVEEWTDYRQKILAGADFEELWTEIAHKIGNPNKGVNLVNQFKDKFPKVIRANDKCYCSALMEMLVSAFSSWVECHARHLEDTKTLEKSLQEKTKDCKEVYDSLMQFSVFLESNKYGLTKKVLVKSLDYARKGKMDNAFFSIPFNEIKNEKYKNLVSADDKVIFAAYKALKIFWKLCNRKKYISMPRMKDYQVPYGLTGKGKKFDLSVKDGCLVATIGNSVLECYRSHYFHDITIVKEPGKFKLKFRHKLKDKKKEVYGDWINAELKEIKIQKKQNGFYYLYLPYTIHFTDETNFKLEKFFMSTEAQLDVEMPFCAVGFDLNLSTPITAASGVFVKNGNGNVQAINVGGNIEHVREVCKDTGLCSSIRNLTSKVKKLVDFIRAYKTSIKNKIEIDKEEFDWVDSELGKNDYSYRYKIQILIAKYMKKKSELWAKCRLNGHNNLSESIRLLELLDSVYSLRNSYKNIHIFDRNKEKLVYGYTNDLRSNFRDFVSKQYAAFITKYCVAEKANIAFIEDLDAKADFDSDMNSISRLFASGQLKKCIKNALNKVGIGCVFVNKNGTSVVDPVTGLPSYRDKKFNKKDLFVLRDNCLGKVDSDLSAAINVLIVGLNHSVHPYKFYVKNGVCKKDGKRMKKFATERSLEVPMVTGYVYPIPTGLVSESEKIARVNRIKGLLLSGENVEKFDLTGENIRRYNAFTVRQILENP